MLSGKGVYDMGDVPAKGLDDSSVDGCSDPVRHEVMGLTGSIVSIRGRIHEDIAGGIRANDLDQELRIAQLYMRVTIGGNDRIKDIFVITTDIGLGLLSWLRIRATGGGNIKDEPWTS